MKRLSLTLVLSSLALAGTAMAEAVTMVCYEQGADDRDGLHEVVIAEDAGRLLASVYLHQDTRYPRLLRRVGVALREAPGRDLDQIYLGRDFKLSYNASSLEGLLEFKQAGQNRRYSVHCE